MSKLALLGGEKVRSAPFSKRATVGTKEKAAIQKVLDKGDISLFFGSPGPFFLGGPEVLSFENKWAKKYNFQHCISVNSWTTGLTTAIGACGIGPGDEVICPPYTMSASATSILFYGGIPVFADIDPDTFNISPTEIKKKITPRTKAIMLVHLFGQPCDMDEIMAIAKQHKLRVIEDAAHAPGVKYKNQYVGAIGDIGGFSLNYHKHIHTGEGGLIVTQDQKLAHKCQLIRNHGENMIEAHGIEDLTNVIGSNYRLTEVQAAMGNIQTDYVEEYVEHRNQLATFMTKNIEKLDFITPPLHKSDRGHAYYLYAMKFDNQNAGIKRSTFAKAVMAEFPVAEIAEQLPLVEAYVRPLYLNPIYQKKIAIGSHGFPFNYNQGVTYDYSLGSCPVVEDMHFNQLFHAPVLREASTQKDMQDLYNAFEKVITNIDALKSWEKSNS